MALSTPTAMGLMTPQPLRLKHHTAQFSDSATEVRPCRGVNSWFARYSRFVHKAGLPPLRPGLTVLMQPCRRLPGFYAVNGGPSLAGFACRDGTDCLGALVQSCPIFSMRPSGRRVYEARRTWVAASVCQSGRNSPSTSLTGPAGCWATGVRRGESGSGVIDSLAAVGHLVDAGPPAGPPAIWRSSVARSISCVDASGRGPVPIGAGRDRRPPQRGPTNAELSATERTAN
jgi:hypothetical protein